ncbi:DUF4270 family protein [Bacteroidota bacterium]
MNNIISMFKPKKTFQIFLGIIPIFILAITFSCEVDPSSLGSNLLPDKIGYRYDTTITFKGNVFEEEPIATTDFARYSLGIISDGNFGTFKGEYLGQFLPYVISDTICYFNIDSAYLFLDIDSVYGDPFASISFNVFELSSEIDEDETYMSDIDISNYYTPAFINGSSSYSGDSLIKIPLSFSFYDRLTSDTAFYRDKESFLSEFNGLAIIPEISESPGGVLVTNITSTDSKIILYYNDSLTYTYPFSTGHRFAKYSNDFSTAVANDYLSNDENENDNLLFLQGITGLSSKLTFTNIDSWFEDDSSYSVINAELFIPVYQDDNFDLFFPPYRLFMEYHITDTTFAYIRDYEDLINKRSNIFDGIYDEENNYYHFYIPKHLMNVLNRDVEDSCLYFNMLNKSFFPQRVIFNSSENIKLKVTYTKH